MAVDLAAFELGYDIPALPGMNEAEVHTPCLLLDLDALERNIRKLGDYARARGLRHRSHGKMHKSVDVQRLQQDLGGAVGVCCQKVSEAEVFARGGITDILLSNQVRDPLKIDRLARLPLLGAALTVCVDDVANVAGLSAAALRHGTRLDCYVELDCGAGRCGVSTPAEALAIARAISAAPGLRFTGLQAYNGALQHLPTAAERALAFATVEQIVRETIKVLKGAGLPPEQVSGAGSGSYYLEAESGLFTELQCGSYAFMDASYAQIEGENGVPLGQTFEPALFLLTAIMSKARPGIAVCDAGLKAQSTDSGLPAIHGQPGLRFTACNDEHGLIADPQGTLAVNDRLRLVPGHCDPTCNLHDWYVGMRGDVVECLWPVSARGKCL
ncbi:DSD1 family PLP-dependent enzyme [Pararhodobacter sp.]|uniref:DSD1 family PLP-dependent enzyme n=1 Tax=Pararhodobacter sp. TaxID=2127056 RepID=UPI002FDE820F